MAEYLFRQMCEKEKIEVKIISRGVDLEQPPTKMNKEAEEALKRYSENIENTSEHVSKPVNLKDLSESDIILVMSPVHKEKILNYANDKIKDLDKKIFTLKSLKGEESEVKDPYNKVLNPLYKLFKNSIPKRFKHLPDFWPFNKYKDMVYDSCRGEILENLEILLNTLKD
jgi:protein-tyrosine-phosphatase